MSDPLGDLVTGFAEGFVPAYSASAKATEARESSIVNQKVKDFLKKKTENDKLKKEDAERIARAKRLAEQSGAPDGSWANFYYWDLDGFTPNQQIEMAKESDWNAIAPPAETEDSPVTPATPVTSNAPSVEPDSEVAPSTVEQQTEAAIPDVGTAGVSNTDGRVLSVRNNNPGNLRLAGQRGATEGEGNFARFETPEAGMAAMRRQIELDTQERGMNLTEFLNKYAPPSDGNDTNKYVAAVAKAAGIDPTEPVPADKIDAIQREMIRIEGGQDAVSYFLEGGASPVAETQPETATPESPSGLMSADKDVEEMSIEDRIEAGLNSQAAKILGITDEEFSAGIKAVELGRPDLMYQAVPRPDSDMPSTWNELLLTEMLESPEWKAAQTQEERLDVAQKFKNRLAKDEPSSAKTEALQLFMSSDEFNSAADPEARLQQWEREWSQKTSTSNGGSQTSKQLRLNILTESEEYKNASPENKGKMLENFEKNWNDQTNSKSGSETYTASNFAAEVAKYEEMLLSDDPAKVQEAEEWMATVKPTREAALQQAAIASSAPADAQELSIRYTDDGGNTIIGTGTQNEDGTYNVVGVQGKVGQDRIQSVTTPEVLKQRASAVQAASQIYKPVRDLRSAVSVSVSGAYELDRIAARNESVLTITGGALSFFDEAKTEIRTALELVGDQGRQGNSRDSVLAAVNQRAEDFIQANNLTGEAAQAYREFNAAVIRYVFAAGKALGQEGNGFSNSDYNNIFKSIVNSNSYEAFSNNLRNFSRTQTATLQETINNNRDDGLILQALEYPGAREFIDPVFVSVEESYQTASGARDPRHFSWLNSRAGAILRVQETVTEQDAQRIPSLSPYVGKGVIIFKDGRVEEI